MQDGEENSGTTWPWTMKEISKKQIPREKCMRLLPKAPQTGLGLVDGVRGGPCVLSVMAFGRWDWGGGEDRVWVRMLLWIGGGGGRSFKGGCRGRGCACGYGGRSGVSCAGIGFARLGRCVGSALELCSIPANSPRTPFTPFAGPWV